VPRQISPEERERRRQRAIQQHQKVVVDEETGLERRAFGGPQPRSGRPRKPRASEVIAEKVQGDAEDFYAKLKEIADGKNAGEARKAIMDLLAIEEKERVIKVQDDRDIDNMKRDELMKFITQQLAELGIDLPEVIEGEYIIVEPEAIERVSS
jgi:hypothetical protein